MPTIRLREPSLKPGFTLIEILIVLSIIMLLTILAVANYSAVERSARIGFAADSLVSSLREAEVLSKSGRRVTDSAGKQILQCQAVKIVSGTGSNSGLYMGQSNYIGLPEEGAVEKAVDSCKPVGDLDWRKNDIFNDRIIIIDDGNEDGNGNGQTFYFKPPFGQIYREVGGGLAKAAAEKVRFSVGALDNADSQQKIEFDLTTGNVARLP